MTPPILSRARLATALALCSLETQSENAILAKLEGMTDEQVTSICLNISANVPPLTLFTHEALVAAGWTPPEPPPG
jgi:hypothetical protein